MKAKTRRNLTLGSTALLICVAAVGLLNPLEDQPTVPTARSRPATVARASITSRPPALTGLSTTEGHRGTGAYNAPVGREMLFDLEAQMDTRLSSKESGKGQDLGYAIVGTMKVSVEGRRDDEVVVHVSFPNADLSASKSEAPTDFENMRDTLGLATHVRMSTDGRTLGYRFPESMNSSTRNLVRGLVSAFRFVVPADAGNAWTTEEQDATGTFAAAYRRGAEERIHKRKVGYSDLEKGAGTNVESTADGVLDRGLGWVREATFAEKFNQTIETFGFTMENRARMSIRLRTHSDVDVTAFRSVDWEGSWAHPRGADDIDAEAPEAREARDRALIEGVQPVRLLRDICDLIHGGKLGSEELIAARKKLIAWIRLHPELLDEQRAMILGQGKATSYLMSVIAGADNLAAETFLSDLAGDAETDPRARFYATIALSALSAPGAQAIEAVRRSIQNEGSSRRLVSSSLLVLGVAASRQETPERAKKLFDELVGMKAQAEKSGLTTSWLGALGNNGSPEVAQHAKPYLGHEEPSIRDSAVSALRQVQTPEATRLIAATLTSDPSADVRATAALLLGARNEPMVLPIMQEIIGSRENPEAVQLAAIEGLGMQVDENGAAKQLLQTTAQRHASQRVREAAQAILTPAASS